MYTSYPLPLFLCNFSPFTCLIPPPDPPSRQHSHIYRATVPSSLCLILRVTSDWRTYKASYTASLSQDHRPIHYDFLPPPARCSTHFVEASRERLSDNLVRQKECAPTSSNPGPTFPGALSSLPMTTRGNASAVHDTWRWQKAPRVEIPSFECQKLGLLQNLVYLAMLDTWFRRTREV